MTTTLQFHDVSHWNGTHDGTGPLFAKATEGRSYVDPQYARNRDRTLDRGDPFAAYHFLDPGSPADQARHAFDVIGTGTCCMLDVERSAGGSATYRDALTFSETYKALGGLLRPAYIPEWYWSGVWKSPGLHEFQALGMWLISSNYTSYSDTGRGWRAYGGLTPEVWQWRGSPLDCDAYKGTKTQLAALLKPPVSAPNPPTGRAPGSRTLRLTVPSLMTGTDVLYVQRFIGSPAGAADGQYGPATVRGVKWYQGMRGAKGAAVDGVVGPWTWGQMGVEYTG